MNTSYFILHTSYLASALAQGPWLDWLPGATDEERYVYAIGLLGLVVFGLFYLVMLAASRREDRLAVSPGACYFGIVGAAALLLYAALKGEIIFVIVQTMNTMILFWVLGLSRQNKAGVKTRDIRTFPVVAPDSAEPGEVRSKK